AFDFQSPSFLRCVGAREAFDFIDKEEHAFDASRACDNQATAQKLKSVLRIRVSKKADQRPPVAICKMIEKAAIRRAQRLSAQSEIDLACPISNRTGFGFTSVLAFRQAALKLAYEVLPKHHQR